MNRVFVVGSANVDLIVQAETLPRRGETVLGGDLVRAVGGKGANQAVAAARLGAAVTMLAAIGDDLFGGQICDALVRESVDISQLRTHPHTPTGVALITVDGAGANTIVVSRGANAGLDRADIDALGGMVRPGDVLLMQLEIPTEACLHAATLARQVGATIVLNAAPLPPSPDEELSALLRMVDVLVANEHEAVGLLKCAIPSNEQWRDVASSLRLLGPAAVVVTLGSNGAVLADSLTVEHVPTVPVAVVDTTGAGDAFCGAFAASLASGATVSVALQRGCTAGALATTMVGAQTALPTAAHLEEMLRSVDAADGRAEPSPDGVRARTRHQIAVLRHMDPQ